jgi:hypothetical protein
LQRVNHPHETGFWVLSGAYMNAPPHEGVRFEMLGSAMVAVAQTQEDVMKVLREDVYCLEGVWDMEKVQIHPFRSSVRSKL